MGDNGFPVKPLTLPERDLPMSWTLTAAGCLPRLFCGVEGQALVGIESRRAVSRGRDIISDGVSLQATRVYAKGVGFEFLFAVAGVSAQETIPGSAG
jgi:hypothetical protein